MTSRNYSSFSHSWNDKDHVFDYQLYKLGAGELFQTSDEVIIIEFKVYVVKLNIKNRIQLLRTMFMATYGSLYLYDEDVKKRFIIANE